MFDLGGGTFDVTLLAIDNGVFEVKATGKPFLCNCTLTQTLILTLILIVAYHSYNFVLP